MRKKCLEMQINPRVGPENMETRIIDSVLNSNESHILNHGFEM